MIYWWMLNKLLAGVGRRTNTGKVLRLVRINTSLKMRVNYFLKWLYFGDHILCSH